MESDEKAINVNDKTPKNKGGGVSTRSSAVKVRWAHLLD